MNWANSDPADPPFLVEVTDDSPEEYRVVAELTETAIDAILASCPDRDNPSAYQIRQMILAGMVYGWKFAQQTGGVERMLAGQQAASKRRGQADARHAEFRKAWESAVAAGRDVSIAQLAKEMGIPRATAYRAVNG
jgi:hypothetical protein